MIALVILLAVVTLIIRPQRGLERDTLSARLSVQVMNQLYRNVRLDRRRFYPVAGLLALMLMGWTLIPTSTGISADLICWLGVGTALLLNKHLGEQLVRRRVDMEAVLFLLALFVMVAAVRRTGMFVAVAHFLGTLPVSPLVQLVVFLCLAGVLTKFSAGPSMAALLEVAHTLAQRLPPHAVYVGLALSVCAGSSLFLTAATSGPMAQALTERADLRGAQGEPIRFGFFQFLPTGLLSFAVISWSPSRTPPTAFGARNRSGRLRGCAAPGRATQPDSQGDRCASVSPPARHLSQAVAGDWRRQLAIAGFDREDIHAKALAEIRLAQR